jgi:hypothetical protein
MWCSDQDVSLPDDSDVEDDGMDIEIEDMD